MGCIRGYRGLTPLLRVMVGVGGCNAVDCLIPALMGCNDFMGLYQGISRYGC